MPKQYFAVISIVLISFLLGAAALVYVLIPQPSASPIIINPSETKKPEVHLYKKHGGLILSWNNLPSGTEYVNIYRSKRGEEKWTKWKTVDLGENSLDGGFISVKSGDDLNGYVFYAEAVMIAENSGSGSGENDEFASGEIILWTSSSTVLEAPPPTSPINATTTGPAAPNETPTSTPSDSPPQTPENQTSTPSLPSSTENNIPEEVYYTPSGEIAGSVPAQTETFWVTHVNRNIEIGWQNIPDSKTVIVYRSLYENGSWSELLRQNDPPSAYSMRLIDNTLGTSHYYRMEALTSAGTSKYGPIFLPALE